MFTLLSTPLLSGPSRKPAPKRQRQEHTDREWMSPPSSGSIPSRYWTRETWGFPPTPSGRRPRRRCSHRPGISGSRVGWSGTCTGSPAHRWSRGRCSSPSSSRYCGPRPARPGRPQILPTIAKFYAVLWQYLIYFLIARVSEKVPNWSSDRRGWGWHPLLKPPSKL